MVELFDADLKRKGFDGGALPAGSYELHKINGVGCLHGFATKPTWPAGRGRERRPHPRCFVS